MLLPYPVKVSDTKIIHSHIHTILALCACACLYRSHLGKPVSTKQTKHSRKSDAKSLCSNCLPLTRTHAFKRLRHCAITVVMMIWSSSLHSPLAQQTFFQLLYIMDPRTVDPLLKDTPHAVVHRIQIWIILWPHLWMDKIWRLSLQHGDW